MHLKLQQTKLFSKKGKCTKKFLLFLQSFSLFRPFGSCRFSSLSRHSICKGLLCCECQPANIYSVEILRKKSYKLCTFFHFFYRVEILKKKSRKLCTFFHPPLFVGCCNCARSRVNMRSKGCKVSWCVYLPKYYQV